MAQATINSIGNHQCDLDAFLVLIKRLDMWQGLDMFFANRPSAKAANAVGGTVTMDTVHGCSPNSLRVRLDGASQSHHAAAHFLFEQPTGIQLRNDQVVKIDFVQGKQTGRLYGANGSSTGLLQQKRHLAEELSSA
jgi:hypothetical protein